MTTRARFEAKCTFAPQHLDRVLTWVRLHRSGLYEAHPERIVRNVYFDDFDLGSWRENLSGQSVRTKVRYRWYGADPEPGAGALELKHKRETLGRKDVQTFTESPFRSAEPWQAFVARIRAALRPELRVVFDEKPVVVLTNAYRRRYFESADRRVRVTVDTELAAFDQWHARSFRRDRKLPLPPVSVLEVKVRADDVRALQAVLAGAPARATRFSKYAVAAALVLGDGR